MNGKIERRHRSLSEECLRQTALIDLDDVRVQFVAHVRRYNETRPHSALVHLTPADFLLGRVEDKLKVREERLNQARSARIKSRNQASGFTLTAN
ncbi:MAG: transposase [Acidobacteria bacterium]|nr:transposase [Acidobacteriota bacterium]